MAPLPRHGGSGAYDDLVTFDCAPTLTDSQVLEFCKSGYIKLEACVPDWVNQKCFARCAEIDGVPNELRRAKGIALPNEPSILLSEDWFVDNVILNPAVTGAIRSLLGRDFGLPTLISNHRHTHDEGSASGQGWHHDGDAIFGPELHNLLVFYYPQDVSKEMGPTGFWPGSQHAPVAVTDGVIDVYKTAAPLFEGTPTTAPAGTVFIAHYAMLHRRAPSMDAGPLGCRNLLKYQYWRTTAPTRDWLIEPEFDHHTANYQTIDGVPYHGRSYIGTQSIVGSSVSSDRFAAEQLFWLSNLQLPPMRGGQGWPSCKHEPSHLQSLLNCSCSTFFTILSHVPVILCSRI